MFPLNDQKQNLGTLFPSAFMSVITFQSASHASQ